MEHFLTGEKTDRRNFVEAFEEFCRRQHVPHAARHAADLALEEHLTNVLNYGFGEGEEPWILVRLHVKNNTLHVKVVDTGTAYDPVAAPAVDTSLPLEEKPIGGLGVYLMKQFMDELSYVREGTKNVLMMTKRFGS